MNFERFIAKRIIFGRKYNTPEKFSGTKPIIRIAVLGIALGVAVMILAVSIVTGFQSEIRSKVIGFGSHIQITSYDSYGTSMETKSISKNQDFYPHLDTVQGVKHIQVYAKKAGIIKTDEEIHGVMVKGIGPDFDWSFFEPNIIEGKRIKFSDTTSVNDVLISKHIANKLKLKTGDPLVMYFIQQPPRIRKFHIAGIYETGMEAFDKSFILGDIQHIQKLNDWKPDQISGFEVLIDNYKDLDKMDEFVYQYIDHDLNSTMITDQHREIFGWLDLQDMNVIIIIVLMILVAGINMISALLILILERTNMVGVLKAIGASNWSIQKIFLYNAVYLIGIGLIAGDILGLGLCLLQKYYGIIKLPQESYYISEVPVNLEALPIVLINTGALILCTLMLVLPSYVVTRIRPVKAIKFN